MDIVLEQEAKVNSYSGKRALVVDDNVGWRDTSAAVLRSLGMEVETASTLTQAKKLVDAEVFNVVLADVRLDEERRSDIAGIELLEFIKRRDSTAKVVLITGHPEALIRVRAGKSFAPDGLLFKTQHGRSLSLSDLRSKIASLLEPE